MFAAVEFKIFRLPVLSLDLQIKIYKIIVLPVGLYETWSPKLRERHILRVFEIAGSNPARSMDVCLRVSVLCCPVFR